MYSMNCQWIANALPMKFPRCLVFFLPVGWDVVESPEKLEPQVTLMAPGGEQKGYILFKRIIYNLPVQGDKVCHIAKSKKLRS